MVCCRDSGAFADVTLFCRNHGKEIFRRPFCDLVGIRPPPPLPDGPAPSPLIVAGDVLARMLLLLLLQLLTMFQIAQKDELRHVFRCTLFTVSRKTSSVSRVFCVYLDALFYVCGCSLSHMLETLNAGRWK